MQKMVTELKHASRKNNAPIWSKLAKSLLKPSPTKKTVNIKKINDFSEESNIVVQGVDGRADIKISEKMLSEVNEPRIKEIFELAKIEVEKNDFKEDYTFGIILTGGGSKLDGIIDKLDVILEEDKKD